MTGTAIDAPFNSEGAFKLCSGDKIIAIFSKNGLFFFKYILIKELLEEKLADPTMQRFIHSLVKTIGREISSNWMKFFMLH